MQENRRGMLLVVSGPSGAGKGTLAARLLENDPTFAFSVSATTRAPRVGEVNGVHYHFMDEAEFRRRLDQEAFIEFACVHGNYYGTLRSEVEERLEKGINVLLDIDVQGACRVMEKMPDAVSVFILPPSLSILRQRLVGRQTDAPEVIERRMNNAKGEMSYLSRYKYVIVNDDLEKAAAALQAIAAAEKQSTVRYLPVIEE